MSINKSTTPPPILHEGVHVVLLRALAERLQGRNRALTDFLKRWLDDATLHNARGRAFEISHVEYSDTVLAYLDPAQRERLQDEDTWIARQLFVGQLIDQILAAPPETIT